MVIREHPTHSSPQEIQGSQDSIESTSMNSVPKDPVRPLGTVGSILGFTSTYYFSSPSMFYRAFKEQRAVASGCEWLSRKGI